MHIVTKYDNASQHHSSGLEIKTHDLYAYENKDQKLSMLSVLFTQM